MKNGQNPPEPWAPELTTGESSLDDASCSPYLSDALAWAESDGSDHALAWRLEKVGKWGSAGDNALEIVAKEYSRVIDAIREYRDAKGLYHTQKARELILTFLPENSPVQAREALPATHSSDQEK
jgi:hypothetical protein